MPSSWVPIQRCFSRSMNNVLTATLAPSNPDTEAGLHMPCWICCNPKPGPLRVIPTHTALFDAIASAPTPLRPSVDCSCGCRYTLDDDPACQRTTEFEL